MKWYVIDFEQGSGDVKTIYPDTINQAKQKFKNLGGTHVLFAMECNSEKNEQTNKTKEFQKILKKTD